MFRARLLHRTRLNRSILTEYLATSSGSTALVGAVVRGDVEIVKILLENGADPSVENDLGMNAFEMCHKYVVVSARISSHFLTYYCSFNTPHSIRLKTQSSHNTFLNKLAFQTEHRYGPYPKVKNLLMKYTS